MNKIYFIIIANLVFLASSFSQYTYFDVHIKGNSTLHQFEVERITTISKTGGNWGINLIYTLDIPLYYGSSQGVLNNTQYRYSYNVITANGISKTSTLHQDSYGNDWLKMDISVGSSYTANSFDVKVVCGLEEKVNLPLNDPLDPLPLTGIPSGISSTYLSPTSIIDSDNSSIRSQATSISSGYSREFEIANEFARWIKSNIAYQIGVPEKASTVLSNRAGDCDGMSNLMIAFCRSIGIPARLNVGFSIKIEKKYPYWGGDLTVSSGNGVGDLEGHACYEVYYPSLSTWITGDPAQQTVNFTHVSNVWIARAPDISSVTNHLNVSGSLSSGETQPTGVGLSSQKPKINSAPTLTADFEYVYHDEFFGSLNKPANIILNTSDRDVPVGIFDAVAIVNAPPGTQGPPIGEQVPPNTTIINPCSPASFFAQFTSDNNPYTYAGIFDWSILLYHSGGTYTYDQKTVGTNTNPVEGGCVWQLTPGALPDYNWLYDPAGNIYGKIKVIAHINDGTTKADEEVISVSPFTNIQNVTYNTNTTVNACATLNLMNVAITNTPTVIFNTNGKGIILNGPFEAQKGSTVIINK